MKKIALIILQFMIISHVSATTLSGTIKPWPSNTIPEGYLLCDGREISRATYSELFDIIGTTYGEGDGDTTFNLPNMQERQIEGTTSSESNGQTGGSNEAIIKPENLPPHTHTIPKLSGTTNSAGSHTHNYSSSIITLADQSNSVSNRWCTVAENSGFTYDPSGGWFKGWNKGFKTNLATNGAHTHTATTATSETGTTGEESETISVENSYIVVNYIIKY